MVRLSLILTAWLWHVRDRGVPAAPLYRRTDSLFRGHSMPAVLPCMAAGHSSIRLHAGHTGPRCPAA